MCKIDSILPLVRKPGRYIDNEIGSLCPDQCGPTKEVAIAFPDVYEIGMSSLAIKMLYHLFHREGIRAERVFSPWIDMEERLRRDKIPLFSLESRTPLNQFTLIAFSLQYELNYTNLLCILDLAGIPFKSGEREEQDPIVVAGGVSVFNPLPILPFFDLFFIGDEEVFIPKIVPIIKDKSLTRNEKLREMESLSGVLSTRNIKPPIKRLFTDRLSSSAIPDPPIVPFIETVHDRLVIEIARGCTRGCRFCQVGIISRPYRERDRKTVVETVLSGLSKTGYEEVTLLSLSVLDHSEIDGIISDLKSRNISLSLPSLRGDGLSEKTARLIGAGGVTFVPEAGTERLRKIINKDIDPDEMIASVKRLKRCGITHAKLYFMIGLPEETEEDLMGIVNLVDIMRRMLSIKVSISPYVPKPHTPFQWERQNSLDEIREKVSFLKHNIRKVKVTYRDPKVSFLEGVFSRGDRRLSSVIEQAYSLGARFDGWTEQFSFEIWSKAFDREGIDPRDYLLERDIEQPLAWDIIETGVQKRWLLRERELAKRGEQRKDCRITGCSGCGICNGDVIPIKKEQSNIEIEYGRGTRTASIAPTKIRYRVMYSKRKELRFIGHLDTTKALIRALKRADLPLVYSQGYKPKARVAFSPPLPLGFTSIVEYLDLILKRPVPDIAARLEKSMPVGLTVNSVDIIPPKAPSLSSSLLHQRLKIERSQQLPDIRDVNIREALLEIKQREDAIELFLKLGKVKPFDLFQILFNISEDEARRLRVERIGWG